jgi:hypothetical protein
MIHNFPNSLSAQPQVRRGGQGTAANCYLAAVPPCLSLCSCGLAESSLTQNRKIDTPNKTRSWEYINGSQIHKCRNWERGRTVSFLGINTSIFGTGLSRVTSFSLTTLISQSSSSAVSPLPATLLLSTKYHNLHEYLHH